MHLLSRSLLAGTLTFIMILGFQNCSGVGVGAGSTDTSTTAGSGGYADIRTADFGFGFDEERLGQEPVFNPKFYANSNADLKAAYGYDADRLRDHWFKYGMNEGRMGSIVFSPRLYLAKYADLREAYGRDYRRAISHYLAWGQFEGRSGDPGLYNPTNAYGHFTINTLQKTCLSLDDPERYRDGLSIVLKERPGRSAADYFTVDVDYNGEARIKTVIMERCLDIEYASQDSGARIQTYRCHGGDNQTFLIRPNEDGSVAFVAKHSGKCVDIPGNEQRKVGLAVWQYECNGTDAQKFFLYR